MQSIKSLYKIGSGSSSSHTMGPNFAAQQFLAANPTAAGYRVTLFNSLAASGRGHQTDRTIYSVLGSPPKTTIVWKPDERLPLHENGMLFEALNPDRQPINRWEVYSVGGGEIRDRDNFNQNPASCYGLSSMTEILQRLQTAGRNIWQYVFENDPVEDHLSLVWQTMNAAIDRGLASRKRFLPGHLPGGVRCPRLAREIFFGKGSVPVPEIYQKVFAYARAVSEENAAGGEVVTAPTCGSSGVVPAVLRFLKEEKNFQEVDIIRALATAGLVGNLVRTNASISGAEVGCQGEIGTASSMAAGAACQLLGGTIFQIEYAAEMAMEHHLGETCDMVGGLVQIPCIERSASAAEGALGSAYHALLTSGKHLISFDDVVAVMYETGKAMNADFRETARGGLARRWAQQLLSKKK